MSNRRKIPTYAVGERTQELGLQRTSHRQLDNKLDEALRQTFPASDPFSVTSDEVSSACVNVASSPCFMHELEHCEYGTLRDDYAFPYEASPMSVRTKKGT